MLKAINSMGEPPWGPPRGRWPGQGHAILRKGEPGLLAFDDHSCSLKELQDDIGAHKDRVTGIIALTDDADDVRTIIKNGAATEAATHLRVRDGEAVQNITAGDVTMGDPEPTWVKESSHAHRFAVLAVKVH